MCSTFITNGKDWKRIVYIRCMTHKHQAWIYEVGEHHLMFRLPMQFDDIHEILQAAVKFIKNITRGMGDANLFMENMNVPYQGETHSCILVFCSEFPVGVLVFNATMSRTNQIGPYSMKHRKLYKTWHKATPEA